MNSYPVFRQMNIHRKDNSKRSSARLVGTYIAYCDLLEATHKEIAETQSVFEEEKVWSDQCDDAIITLQKLNNITQTLAEMIDKQADLLGEMRHQRYPLLVELCQISAQSREATSYIRNLSCAKQTHQAKLAHNQIRSIITKIDSNLGKLPYILKGY